jgi:hypothetical protein
MCSARSGSSRPTPVEQPGEVPAPHVAHRQEQHAVALADTVDRDDVRMLERSRQARLAQEALAEALVARELGQEDLQRHAPLERDVLGRVHRARRALTDQRLDPVARQCRSVLELGHGPTLHPAASAVKP